jgi:GNAT superfamily N-acetyltransferase
MAESDYLILPEGPEDHDTIEQLLDAAFGLERRTKTAYRLREGSTPIADLCFTARLNGEVVGSIQYWPIVIGGETEALLLGPLAVAPELQGKGCGLALMKHSLAKARELGHPPASARPAAASVRSASARPRWSSAASRSSSAPASCSSARASSRSAAVRARSARSRSTRLRSPSACCR